ncbi:MAG: hypothetical protein QF415_16735 [Candidatus Undinarchaeales archaeon]|jgi:hypothetical protein|nr:hypothetical protein [Candidatus Undinarchaeales archaeon]MDP7493044.1 hypothetical protein [Candidatus Undinarchaeales archaeon]
MAQDILDLLNETTLQLLMTLDGVGDRGATRSDLLVTALPSTTVRRYLELFYELRMVTMVSNEGTEPRYVLDHDSTVLILLLGIIEANNNRLFLKRTNDDSEQAALAEDLDTICADGANDIVIYKPLEKRFLVVKSFKRADESFAYIPHHPVSVVDMDTVQTIRDKVHIIKGYRKVIAAMLLNEEE